jgi:hypothetical protein
MIDDDAQNKITSQSFFRASRLAPFLHFHKPFSVVRRHAAGVGGRDSSPDPQHLLLGNASSTHR